MKFIYFCTINDPNHYKRPKDFMVRADAIVSVERHENGSWVNGRWASENTYTYEVSFVGNRCYEVDEATYNKIIAQLKDA